MFTTKDFFSTSIDITHFTGFNGAHYPNYELAAQSTRNSPIYAEALIPFRRKNIKIVGQLIDETLQIFKLADYPFEFESDYNEKIN